MTWLPPPDRLTPAQTACVEAPTDQPLVLRGGPGSGKTVVAALAAAIAMEAGWQCALMAPTEILAEQHFRKLVGWLAPLGLTIAWLTGSRKGRARDAMVAHPGLVSGAGHSDEALMRAGGGDCV